MQEGRWRNPGLTPAAREINSRTHKHSGALAEANERFKAGARTADLTPEQQEAHHAYHRQLEAALREESNASRRSSFAGPACSCRLQILKSCTMENKGFERHLSAWNGARHLSADYAYGRR